MDKPVTSSRLWLASESHEYRDTKAAAMRRRILTGDTMMVALWRIGESAGPTPYDNHPDNEQFGIILRGGLDFRIDGERHRLGPGDVYWAPKGCDHGDSRFIGDPQTGECWIADIFAPPREDYRNG